MMAVSQRLAGACSHGTSQHGDRDRGTQRPGLSEAPNQPLRLASPECTFGGPGRGGGRASGVTGQGGLGGRRSEQTRTAGSLARSPPPGPHWQLPGRSGPAARVRGLLRAINFKLKLEYCFSIIHFEAQ